MLSTPEIQKCGDMAVAFSWQRLKPEIQCVSAESPQHCMEWIQVGLHPEERSWPGGQAVAVPGMVLASPPPEPPGLKPTRQPGAAVSCDNLTGKREEEGPARTSHPTPGDGAGGGAVSFQGTQERFLAEWVS